MNRIAVLVALLFAGGACRQRETTATDATIRPMLWAAEKDGTTTYLMGTMHIGTDVARLPALVFEKLDGAPQFAMETDVEDAALLEGMRRASGTLHDELGPADWAKLEAIIGREQARAIDGMKPMVAATLMSMRGVPQTAPMDGALRDRARGAGKPVLYLETAADEMVVLDRHMDRRAVSLMLVDPARGAAMTRRTADIYARGDEAALAELVETERAYSLAHGYTAAEYDQLVEDLLYRRNAAWIPAIERMHAAGGGFVAVGAMHLAGPHSVRELLAQRGFKIARL